MPLDSIGNETEDKTTGGKLISQAGDFASSILGLSKTKQNQQSLDQREQELALNRDILALEKEKQASRGKTIITIAIIFFIVMAIMVYIFFFNKRFKII